MSTKTTFKRVAAVAVAALALGGVSAVSAHAADGTNYLLSVQTADGIANGATVSGGYVRQGSGVGVAGVVNTVQIAVAADAGDKVGGTGATRTTTGHAYIVTTSGASSTITAATYGTVNTAGTQVQFADGTSAAVLTVATPTAGTITLSIYQESSAGIYSSTPAETVTITVGSAGVADTLSASLSTVYAYSGVGTAADSYTATSDAAFSVSADKAGAITTPVASFKVTQNDANGNAMVTLKAVSVTTTIGNIETLTSGGTASAAQGSYFSATPAAAVSYYGISPDGRSGVGTVTIAINGVTVKTYSVTFYSTTVASIKATVNHAYVSYAVPTFVAADLTQVASYTTAEYNICAVGSDALGNVVKADSKLTAKSSDTTIATVNSTRDSYTASTGTYCWTVTGVKAGTATITIKRKYCSSSNWAYNIDITSCSDKSC